MCCISGAHWSVLSPLEARLACQRSRCAFFAAEAGLLCTCGTVQDVCVCSSSSLLRAVRALVSLVACIPKDTLPATWLFLTNV